jgi:hypothetical protein
LVLPDRQSKNVLEPWSRPVTDYPGGPDPIEILKEQSRTFVFDWLKGRSPCANDSKL